MPETEVQRLKRQVQEADLSVANPRIQQIFENELAHWVKSYETKKDPRHSLHDCYGGPGEIPDSVEIDGGSYSPPEILEHVRARDEVGMTVLRQMEQYRDQHKLFGKVKEGVIGMVKDDTNLDDVALQCICGQHNMTYRQVLEGMVEGNPDLMFLTVGLPNSVMRLYGRVEEF